MHFGQLMRFGPGPKRIPKERRLVRTESHGKVYLRISDLDRTLLHGGPLCTVHRQASHLSSYVFMDKFQDMCQK